MITRMYAIKDELSGFMFPVPIENDRDAKGWFMDRIKESRIMLENPSDFNLYYLGTYDTKSGTFIHDKEGIHEIMKGVERDERNSNSKITI